LGSETGHGWGNWNGNDHVGPYTSTDETLVANPHPPPAQVPSGRLLAQPLRKGNWVGLAPHDRIANAPDDDLPGIKFWVDTTQFSEVVVSLWTTARYVGPWRQPQRVPESLFTEAHYRSWALLARWIAEENLLPRNFAVLPHKMRSSGFGTAGHHGTETDAVSFSTIVLADETMARSPRTFGLPAVPAIPTAADLQRVYRNPGPVNDVNMRWAAMFDVMRGIHGHGFSGDLRKRDHDCPGPMFDWHRFAREVWDWWWYPFDFDATTPNAAVAARPYSLPTRDGDTPLKEYYWATPRAVPPGRVVNGVMGAGSSPQTFELPDASRVYAVANGELVAARFPAETGQVSMAFMLVRHEVFHAPDPRPAAPAAAPPVFADRIDYNAVDPTIVYTLYMHLGRPTGINFAAVVDQNPDWLNRVLTRKKEAELGVAFKASARGQAVAAAKWNDVPPSMTGTRPTLAAAWDADNRGLAAFVNALSTGATAVVPLDADATPIRILLGDFMASAGVISRDHASTKRGVRVEVFSNDLISTLFTVTDTSTTTNTWAPGPGAATQAVRYCSEWARTLTDAEKTSLQVAGVDLSLIDWWPAVVLATGNPHFSGGGALARNGMAYHYELTNFMDWLNLVTWKSEWPKYRTVDAGGGVPAAPRPR
jgi:hypothetical protein